jgi:hypothetical protein
LAAKNVISYDVVEYIMSEVVNRRDYGKNQSDLAKYSYMCDECGIAFESLDEYVEHYRGYHPSSIGTAIT